MSLHPVFQPEYNKAKTLLRNSDPETAKSVLKERIRKEGESPEYLLLLGVSNFRLNQYNEAEKELLKVIEYGYEVHKAFFYLGLCKEMENYTENAIYYFREAIRSQPEFEPAREKLREYNIFTYGMEHTDKYSSIIQEIDEFVRKISQRLTDFFR